MAREHKPFRIRPGLYRYRGYVIRDCSNPRAGDKRAVWACDTHIFSTIANACEHVDRKLAAREPVKGAD